MANLVGLRRPQPKSDPPNRSSLRSRRRSARTDCLSSPHRARSNDAPAAGSPAGVTTCPEYCTPFELDVQRKAGASRAAGPQPRHGRARNEIARQSPLGYLFWGKAQNEPAVAVGREHRLAGPGRQKAHGKARQEPLDGNRRSFDGFAGFEVDNPTRDRDALFSAWRPRTSLPRARGPATTARTRRMPNSKRRNRRSGRCSAFQE